MSLSDASGEPATPDSWRADHHMHLASPELCSLVGECVESNHPPAVYAADAVRALDNAHVDKGVILSCAYLYGLKSLHLSNEEVARLTRRENEFVASQVARYPTRLVGFFSVNPLQPSAVEEVRHWREDGRLIGLKLHFAASAVLMKRADDRIQIAKVLAAAAGLPMVIHLGGADVGADDAEIFIRDVLPSAGSSWVQIAHAGGGAPSQSDNNVSVLRTFADHIAAADPRTAHVLFDLAFVPFPEYDASMRREIARQLRRAGIERLLYGSDFNVMSPVAEIGNLKRLALNRDELRRLHQQCAPWAC